MPCIPRFHDTRHDRPRPKFSTDVLSAKLGVQPIAQDHRQNSTSHQGCNGTQDLNGLSQLWPSLICRQTATRQGHERTEIPAATRQALAPTICQPSRLPSFQRMPWETSTRKTCLRFLKVEVHATFKNHQSHSCKKQQNVSVVVSIWARWASCKLKQHTDWIRETHECQQKLPACPMRVKTSGVSWHSCEILETHSLSGADHTEGAHSEAAELSPKPLNGSSWRGTPDCHASQRFPSVPSASTLQNQRERLEVREKILIVFLT